MAAMKQFGDLKALRDQLKADEQARVAAAAERAQRDRIAHAEANVFRGALGDVKQIKPSDRYVYMPPPPVLNKPDARARYANQAEDDAAVLRESLSDGFDVDGLLDEDPNLSYARPGVGPEVVRKLRRRHWPVQDECDLHGLARDAARDATSDFVQRAARRGARCVRVIHGKGYNSAGGAPVLRGMVHSWLVQMDAVLAFCAASRADGGDGALIVLLHNALDAG